MRTDCGMLRGSSPRLFGSVRGIGILLDGMIQEAFVLCVLIFLTSLPSVQSLVSKKIVESLVV